jgi:1,4-alpha-glucan branching enzyme
LDAGFVYPIREELAKSRDPFRSMATVRNALENRYNGNAFQRVLYVESHDEVSEETGAKKRLPEQIEPGNATGWFARKRATLGAALVFTAPGIPMLFQGQEWLEWERFDDELPLNWNRADANPGSIALFRDLARLRRNWFNTTRGLRGQHLNVHHVNEPDKLIAFHRWDQGGPRDDVLIVANFADRG